MEYAQISRDPFARETLVRRVSDHQIKCTECGNTRMHKGKVAYAFEYGTERDSISGGVNWHLGAFCSKSCHDSYHS
jgi:hypothetical protein